MQVSKPTDPIKELIKKIQTNHSDLSLDESDKFRKIFDSFNKYKKLSSEELSWLKKVADRY